MTRSDSSRSYPAVIENASAEGRFILVCEHASNEFPAEYGNLGLGPDARAAHIAWDPGALGLARALAKRLDAVLVRAQVSRLVYDCNRAPDAPGAMTARSEVFDIPGNAGLTPQDRADRAAAIYQPFHAGLHGVIAQHIALGLAPVVVTIHSFTPVWFGQRRTVEFGVIHDADPRYAEAILSAARKLTSLSSEMNAPYSAADDVTHTLRLQATPYGLTNAMLEFRNDLIASPTQQEAMADEITNVLNAALGALECRPDTVARG